MRDHPLIVYVIGMLSGGAYFAIWDSYGELAGGAWLIATVFCLVAMDALTYRRN